MSQYKTGTIAIDSASPTIVVGIGALWSLSNTPVTELTTFKVAGLPNVYPVDSINYELSSDGTQTLHLVAPGYTGDTITGLGYQITRDFTPNRSYPELSMYDADFATYITRALRMIDVDMATVLTGGSNNSSSVNSKNDGYTLALTDMGGIVYHPAEDATERTWTIPANVDIAFPVGSRITLVNDISAGAITITITSDTLLWVGSGEAGTRVLEPAGRATLEKVSSTGWIISGSNLT